MKTETYESLGHEFIVEVPTTASDYNALAKRPNVDACCEDAVDHIVMHSTLGSFRNALCALVEEVHKVPRQKVATGKTETVEETGPDGKVVKKEVPVTKIETPEAYMRRVAAKLGLNYDADGGAFPDLAKRLSAGGDKVIAFDPSTTVRTAKEKKLPEDYRNAAIRVIDNNNWEKQRANLKKALAGKDIGEMPKDREQAIVGLGWAIREFYLAEQKKTLAKLG